MKKLLIAILIIGGLTSVAHAGFWNEFDKFFGFVPKVNKEIKLGATFLFPSGGGTGTSTNPSYGQMLVGNSGGTYTLTATSSLGITEISPDWLKQTNYGVLNLTASTTIPYWAKDAFYASSTSVFQGLATFGNASTSQISASSGSYLGTVFTGTWNGTAISNAYVDDDITLTNLTQITNRAISDTSGTLAVGRGGTGLTTFTSSQLIYGNGTEALSSVATTSLTATSPLSLSQPISVIGSSASALTISVAGDWTGTIDSNNFAGGAIGAGELIYGGSAGSFSELALGTNGYVLALSGGIPAWVATTTLSTITGTLAVAKGGTGQTSFGQGWLNSNGTTLSASTSPTVNYIVATSTTATSTFATGGLTVGTNQFVVQQNSGNVGIGTTSPRTLLSVSGIQSTHGGLSDIVSVFKGTSADVNSFLAVDNNDTNKSAGYRFFKQGVSKGSIGIESDDRMSFFVNDGSYHEGLSVKSNGNVGIGTTSPAKTLSVAGTGYFTGNVGIGAVSANVGLEVYGTTLKPGVAWGTGAVYLSSNESMAINLGGTLLFGGNYTGTTNTDWAAIVGWKENATDSNTSGYLGFYTKANGGSSSEKLRITSAGNVGIGTTSPATSLDVNGTITQLTVKSCALGLTTNALGSITGCVASDAKLKKNINPLSQSLNTLLKLKPVTYQWKKDTQNHAGFVAQQVEKVFPEAVVSAGENIKGVDSNAILSLVVHSFQDLYKDFQKLLARVSGLEEKLQKQQKQINNLQEQINNLKK